MVLNLDTVAGIDSINSRDKELTPIEKRDGIYVKRDDLYSAYGARGGKARSAKYLIDDAVRKGYSAVVTAGARQSPQIPIVARIASAVGIGGYCFCPSGELSRELSVASEYGIVINQVRPGYNSVINGNARNFADNNGYYLVPFGMECWEAVYETAGQVENVASAVKENKDIKRIVMAAGSGMSLSGVLSGLEYYGIDIPVVGIRVGADPRKQLDRYAPVGWGERCNIIEASVGYKKYINASIGGLVVDPVYEAKCVEFLGEGDLFWIVGIREGY